MSVVTVSPKFQVVSPKQYGAVVWTMDADFSGLAGVRYFPKRK